MNYILRALDPREDLDHLKTAYSWRTARRREQGDEVIPFAEFAAEKPDEVSFGLFNGELQAVYLVQQRAPGVFQVHFASRRKAPRVPLVAGAIRLRSLLFQNGARELFGLLSPEHARPRHPLRKFAESVGFSYSGPVIIGKMRQVFVKFSARR